MILNVGMGKFSIEKIKVVVSIERWARLKDAENGKKICLKKQESQSEQGTMKNLGDCAVVQVSLEWLVEYKKNKDIKFFMPCLSVL